MVGTGQPMRPFWVRWWGWGVGGVAAWLDGVVVELDRCRLLFSKQAPPLHSAITSIMAIQRAEQASLHGL